MLGPLIISNSRIQVVMPTFAALFSDPPWQRCGDVAPVLSPQFVDHLGQDTVLFCGPRSFDHCWIENFLPSVKALDVRTIVKERRYSFPVLGAVVLDQFPQLHIFLVSPIPLEDLFLGLVIQMA